MSLATTYAMMKERERSGAKDGMRVLVVAPSIIVPKWANSEIPEILGSEIAKTTILNSTEDAIQYAQKVDRKSTRLNSSHVAISYAVFCLKKKRLEHKHVQL